MRASDVRVGTSGWRYAGWRGDFYPDGLPQRRELEYLAHRLSTVEINGSFYSLQSPDSYRRWRNETPEDFVFSVKGGRYLTHMLRLTGTDTALANFFASGVLVLGRKLGPVLWQLPERFTFDREVFESFFSSLPRTHAEAAHLAAGHDDKVKRVEIPEDADESGIRYALEVRHDSFASDEALTLLRRHDIALVAADTAGKWPLLMEHTADFAYLRLHGPTKLYHGGYSPELLRRWRDRAAETFAGAGALYAYFDNDADGRAPYDAEAFARTLRGTFSSAANEEGFSSR
ncbi:Uncharacterized conserved protein YecE, DUF72 family [Paramicrobacterium humi]|uniref:Uncharacterized conserved protein YecE, DUF72 family n=1 Tax=Paramicrobacterium humi TaxID=640635 RepID=A0A1H4TDV7_9MICO|nr:DUF72 domain-containing protein [Microbacterium humi]SEC54703.1 Uncharacterized conserved protein YecE, DUF72 family [Microbacterium humi]